MFTIGDFANLGRVSVRMLRHYDSIGVLRPAAVDPINGYRLYNADQLSRLNRVVALKDLGFTLAQVHSILEDAVDPIELRGMLRLRRAQLEMQLNADSVRLRGVEARLRIIEEEGTMSTQDVVLKPIESVRIAEMTARANTFQTVDIAPTIQALYPELMQNLDSAQVQPTGPAIAYYEPVDADDSVIIHAGITVSANPSPDRAFRVLDLPAVNTTATLIHHGSMDHVEASYQELASWIEANGYRTAGFFREFYLDYDPADVEHGVTELQVPVEKA
jgi:DNA-binding transcriptional MerR regulator